MKYPENFDYMATTTTTTDIIETVADIDNSFLSRRELTCNFAGLGGKLTSLQAVDMVAKKFKLDGKVVIPLKLKTHVGKPLVTGTFYVYDDEGLAKKHIDPTIFTRLEKAKAKTTKADNGNADDDAATTATTTENEKTEEESK